MDIEAEQERGATLPRYRVSVNAHDMDSPGPFARGGSDERSGCTWTEVGHDVAGACREAMAWAPEGPRRT